MNPPPLFIIRDDYIRLGLLLSSLGVARPGGVIEKLRGELARATIIDSAEAPADLVTMHARVEFEYLGTGEVEEYVLVYPERADAASGRLSILAPVGTALLGLRAGDTIDWPTPGGMRRLQVRRVTQPAVTAG
jgi:regulator of nucleoside diphosphate kinase